MSESKELSSTYRTNQGDMPKPIDRLFLKMATAYGKHWMDAWAGVPVELVKQDWQDAISKNNFTVGTVLKAVEVCREKHDFPPTLPEFIKLCKAQQKQPFVKAIGRKFTAEEMAANLERLKDAAKVLTVKPNFLSKGEK